MTPATPAAPPSLDALNAMAEPDVVAVLGDLFEHSPWVMQAAAAHRPFETAQMLHDAAMDVVRAAGREVQISLFRAHPELAGQEATTGALTPDSGGEQARLGFDRLNPADHAELAALNAEYTARFGFPCIVALVRHTTRECVIATMRQRVDSSEAAEIEANLEAIGTITAARLTARLGRAQGGLSMHALDNVMGGGAEGLRYTLFRAVPPGWCAIRHGVTNGDGRSPGPLLAPLEMEPGRYRIEYEVGAYHRARGADSATVQFLDVVPIEFGVADAALHYHVPLLFTPWTYTTYRGN